MKIGPCPSERPSSSCSWHGRSRAAGTRPVSGPAKRGTAGWRWPSSRSLAGTTSPPRADSAVPCPTRSHRPWPEPPGRRWSSDPAGRRPGSPRRRPDRVDGRAGRSADQTQRIARHRPAQIDPVAGLATRRETPRDPAPTDRRSSIPAAHPSPGTRPRRRGAWPGSAPCRSSAAREPPLPGRDAWTRAAPRPGRPIHAGSWPTPGAGAPAAAADCPA